MKPEARVVASACANGLCVALIVRSNSIDGVVMARGDCLSLCSRLSGTGYLNEVRYFLGPCDCGVEPLEEDKRRTYQWAIDFATKIAAAAFNLVVSSELLTHGGRDDCGAGVPEPGQRGRA